MIRTYKEIEEIVRSLCPPSRLHEYMETGDDYHSVPIAVEDGLAFVREVQGGSVPDPGSEFVKLTIQTGQLDRAVVRNVSGDEPVWENARFKRAYQDELTRIANEGGRGSILQRTLDGIGSYNSIYIDVRTPTGVVPDPYQIEVTGAAAMRLAREIEVSGDSNHLNVERDRGGNIHLSVMQFPEAAPRSGAGEKVYKGYLGPEC